MESIECPKGHGKMHKYEAGILQNKYVCKKEGCNLKLDFDNDTGEVTKVVGVFGAFLGIAAGHLYKLDIYAL
jgi:hypothetical protein